MRCSQTRVSRSKTGDLVRNEPAVPTRAPRVLMRCTPAEGEGGGGEGVGKDDDENDDLVTPENIPTFNRTDCAAYHV